MKQTVSFLLAAVGAAAMAQGAAPGDTALVENARVRSSTPVYTEVKVPHTECSAPAAVAAKPAERGTPSVAGIGLGAVAGGLLGHTIGGGNGKSAATAVGAVAGALVGNHLANRADTNAEAPAAESSRECRTVHEVQTQLTGYRVRYEWAGREFETVLREDPGKSVPVRVSVVPVDGRR